MFFQLLLIINIEIAQIDTSFMSISSFAKKIL